jgi:Nucleotidyl transferase AbiEii toxin, Type IV TA system
MADVRGDFEIHLTVYPSSANSLEAYAREHGLKYSSIVLARGDNPVQPMVTVRARGRLDEVRAIGRKWERKLYAKDLYVMRTKIEAAPWNDGVPVSDEDAVAEPEGRYFEHHVKLSLPDESADRLITLAELVIPHHAHLSRNARRRDGDRHERFVTQRCHNVGRRTAQARLEELTAALRAAGQEILEVEAEYVVFDSALHHDSGWIIRRVAHRAGSEDQARSAPAGLDGYPSTYQPLPDDEGVLQSAAFDPALKQFSHAYRAGEPLFADREAGRRWRTARREALTGLLDVIATSAWADHLILRGSVPLRMWLGDAAREPGDLDFVVLPSTMDLMDAEGMLRDIVAAADRAGLRTHGVAVEDIWTYERAPGRRIVLPGRVQVDFVFHEYLPIPPIRLAVGNAEILTAPPELALAWKVLWLETDSYPQGKDLYDAVLLAEHTPPALDLIREVLREQGIDGFGAPSVLRWNVDWDNFLDEYPGLADETDVTHWQHRLARALDRG